MLRYCIQCTDLRSGKVGTFAFDPSARFVAVSPVFDSLQYLCDWFRANGYVPRPGSDMIADRV